MKVANTIEVIDINKPKEKSSKKAKPNSVGSLFSIHNLVNCKRNRWAIFQYFLLIILVVVIGLIVATIVYFVITSKPKIDYDQCDYKHESYNLTSDSLLGNYTKYSVAVDNAFCSKVGKDILLRNGSAVDAAIASGLCNGIANAQSAGIGGGNFMIIYLKEKNKVYAIDAREQAPLTAHEYMFANKSSLVGGLAAGIPGELYGYWEAHKIGGRLQWKELFQPAINMCRNGFKVSIALANAIRLAENDIRNNKELSQIFINSTTNKTYQLNDFITINKLADTLEILSNENISAFYTGRLASQMVQEINENGGNVSLQDFKNYKALVKEAFTVDLDENYKLYTAPLPSSGLLVSLIMRIMKKFNLTSETFKTEHETTLFYHRLIETFKHTFNYRSLLGDENYEKMNNLLDKLKDEKLVNELKAKIADKQTYPSSFYGKSSGRDSHGTTHLSVYADGDAVSLTSTINVYFGSKFAGKHTGIIYNNQMDDFSTPNLVNYFGLQPSEANYIKPGKRPMSSMSPIIILDKHNKVRLVLGASGGSKIITAVAQVAIKNLWMNKSIKESIDERRVHHQLYPEYAEIEIGFDSNIKQLLRNKGHQMKCFNYGGSVLQGIALTDSGIIEANCDARKGGQSEGI